MSKEELDRVIAEANKANNLAALNNDIILEDGMSMRQIYSNPDLWYMLEGPERKKPVQSRRQRIKAFFRKPIR